jgi:small subunit ribosomal protein S20
MPIIKSAIKKMRKDKVRTIRNKKREDNFKSLIKKVRQEKTDENLTAVFSALDKAVKVHLIHKNKASRLKSRLSKGTGEITTKPTTKKPTRKKSPVKKVQK